MSEAARDLIAALVGGGEIPADSPDHLTQFVQAVQTLAAVGVACGDFSTCQSLLQLAQELDLDRMVSWPLATQGPKLSHRVRVADVFAALHAAGSGGSTSALEAMLAREEDERAFLAVVHGLAAAAAALHNRAATQALRRAARLLQAFPCEAASAGGSGAEQSS